MKSNKRIVKINKVLYLLSTFTTYYGTAIFAYAMSVCIVELTGTASIYSEMYALATISVILLSIFSGYICDKYNKKKIAMYNDVISGLICLLGWYISNTKVFLGVTIILVIVKMTDSVYSVAYKGLIKELFAAEEIESINSNYSLVRQTASLFAPMIASLLFIIFPYRFFILLNALSYFISASITYKINYKYERKINTKLSLREMRAMYKEGIEYLKTNSSILHDLIIAAASNFFIGIIPILVTNIVLNNLGYSQSVLSVILLIEAIGAICGSFFASRFPNLSAVRCIQLGLLSLLFSGINVITLTLGLFLAAFFNVIFNIKFFTGVMSNTSKEHLSKVLSIVVIIAKLMIPFGIFIFSQMSFVDLNLSITIISLFGFVTILFLDKFVTKT